MNDHSQDLQETKRRLMEAMEREATHRREESDRVLSELRQQLEEIRRVQNEAQS